MRWIVYGLVAGVVVLGGLKLSASAVDNSEAMAVLFGKPATSTLTLIFTPADCRVSVRTLTNVQEYAAAAALTARFVMIEPPDSEAEAVRLARLFAPSNGSVVLDEGDKIRRVMLQAGLTSPLAIIRQSDSITILQGRNARSLHPLSSDRDRTRASSTQRRTRHQ